MEIINESEEIFKRLEKDDKVKIIDFSDKMEEFNKQMKKISEESRIKQINSWNSAKDIWLD